MKFKMLGDYFNGEFTSNESQFDVVIERECPSNTDVTLYKAEISYKNLSPVIESANLGFNSWRTISTEERIAFLKRYQDEVIKIKDQMAEAISLESGKPIWEATGEAQSVIGKVDVTINDGLQRIAQKSYPEIMPNTQGELYYKPLGPCLIIGPFNFPCHLANTQILNALISGNSVIFKPSEKTCYSAQLMIECFHRAGFPKGVVNLYQGDGEVARRLLKEKTIKGVFFTGSKEVGLKIVENTYKDLSKLVSLELGGKNPAIIHSDTNLNHALSEMLKGSFMTTGQRCTSTSLIILHRSLIQEFTEKFHQYAKKIIIDHPIEHEKEPFMGPLVDKNSLDSYLLYMGMAKREGIEEVMRGKHIEKKFRGYYVTPSIHLAEKFDPKSIFLTSEIFGPNATIVPYDDIDEAIALANSNEYGLASCAFTKDRSLFEKCAREIESGLINWNRSTAGASPKLPFGGVKNSGNYRPASIATIDSCVYQMASLEVGDENDDLDSIKGIEY